MDYKRVIDHMRLRHEIARDELEMLLEMREEHAAYLYQSAREVCDEVYGKKIFMRGLIEYTNYCKNNCFYCGIRAGHVGLSRYRLTNERIMASVVKGYALGARTFVIQGGENPMDSDESIVEIIRLVHATYPDCAITLSVGEKSKETYQKFFDAGASRYLLRHETANRDHYRKLHPANMSYEHRIRCLFDLKEIGFQVGCGMMIGTPGQDVDCLYDDLVLIMELNPHMIGIGPFIAHSDTPFSTEKGGDVETTLRMIAIIRLIHPKVLLPATTALASVDMQGYEKAIMSGANVVMPNITPHEVKGSYMLYDGKEGVNLESEEQIAELKTRIEDIGYELCIDRGDSLVE